MRINRISPVVIVSAFIFIAWAAVSSYAQTSSIEAKVTSISGRPTISGNGRNNVRLANGTALQPGDEIDTRAGGRVVIDLTDGSQVIVMPGSRVVVGSFTNAASLRELMQIILGRIRVKINHFKGKPNPYRVKSPTASIAVRGTEFEVIVEPNGETKIVVFEGSVAVTSLRDPANPLIAEPGRNVIVRPDFTVNYFSGGEMTKEVGDRDSQNTSNADSSGDRDVNQSAANIYERSLDTIVETGETALPSRFAAFPDPFLDSLGNPAYAGDFTTAQGRFYFVPSFNGSAQTDEELRDQFGLGKPKHLDYGIIPEGSAFFPVKKYRAVFGGSFGSIQSGSQAQTADENVPLDSPPFPIGTNGLRASFGTSSGKLFYGSFIFAKQFGSHDQTSIGFRIERLLSRGNLNDSVTLTAPGGLSVNELIASRSTINRTRVSIGFKHNFHKTQFGAFYRYGVSSGSDIDTMRLINGIPQSKNSLTTTGRSYELGMRVRGQLSNRLYYGAEGSLLFGRMRENLTRSVIVNSAEHDRTSRMTLGFGLGYVFRPRTIFSFDVAGGLINTNQRRTEVLTGNLLETDLGHARFLSLHGAVQTDIGRNVFGSASLLSITNSGNSTAAFFPDRFGRITDSDGFLRSNRTTRTLYTDIYSNYGIGYRFTPNLVFQYIFSTDYGQTRPRHSFLLRYTFDFKGK